MAVLLVSKLNYENKLSKKLMQVNSVAVIGEPMVEISDQVDELKSEYSETNIDVRQADHKSANY